MIAQTTAGAVPVLVAPTTGPLRAGLVFRVGFADEPLARRGITHLVEHLVLHPLGVADYHYNGATGAEYTHFHVQGSEPEIVAFLNGVCASLRDLPMHRLPLEKELLLAEANGRSTGAAEPMARWRYGARDHGMSGYPEWGLPAISEDDLRAWVAGYFTSQNAVLWVAGDAVPADLRLDLPSGTRRPAPRSSSVLPVTPAYCPGSPGVVVWDTVVQRTAGAGVFAAVLERMMFRELRQDEGLSYTVQTDLQPVGRDRAVVTALADSLPEKQGAVLGAFIDILAAMRVGRIDPADVAAVIKTRIESLRHADGTADRLPAQACDLLAGRPVDGRRAVAAIDSGTRPEVRVDQPARDSQYVPQPRPEPQPAEPTAAATTRDRMIGLLGLFFFWPLTVLFGGLAALFAIVLLTDSEDRVISAGLALVCAAVMAGGVFGIRSSVRRRSGVPRSAERGRAAADTSRSG